MIKGKMENKYQSFLGGRVGSSASESPYRDHHISNTISVNFGLDTPLKEHSGLLDHRGIL